MQYSDTTNKNGLIQRIEDHTQLGDGVISGDTTLLKKITAYVNEEVLQLTSDIMTLQDSFDWDDPYKTDFPIATTPLIAGQRDYQFDNLSFLRLKRVDVTYDGTNWVRATPLDSRSFPYGLGNDDLVDQKFSTSEPYYDPKSFGFWLYPRASAAQVTAGAKARIEYSRAHNEYAYTDTTKEPPIDRPFHDLIAIGVALRFPNTPDKQYQKLSIRYAEMRERMIQHYSKRNEDEQLTWTSYQINNYT